MAAISPALIANPPTAYDGLGWFYDRYWRNLCTKMMPALDRLVLTDMSRHSRVLDLCCGTGHLSACLCRRGLKVTGVDGSADMLEFAARNAPRAQFVVADARNFDLPAQFDAVISTGDSLNHMLTEADFGAVARSVLASLKPGGRFVFDMNMAEAFETEWRNSSTVTGDDHLMYVRGGFDRSARLGRTEVTLFRLEGRWARQDFAIYQRCYRRSQVRRMLTEAGFTRIEAHPAKSLGIRGRLSVGRTFFVAYGDAH